MNSMNEYNKRLFLLLTLLGIFAMVKVSKEGIRVKQNFRSLLKKKTGRNYRDNWKRSDFKMPPKRKTTDGYGEGDRYFRNAQRKTTDGYGEEGDRYFRNAQPVPTDGYGEEGDRYFRNAQPVDLDLDEEFRAVMKDFEKENGYKPGKKMKARIWEDVVSWADAIENP